MTLYEIKTEYMQFIEAVLNGEIPEEAVNDTLESIKSEFNDKAESYGLIIKNLDAEAKALKEEEKTLAERRKAKEALRDRLKEALLGAMQETGEKKFETSKIVLSCRAYKKVEIDDESLFIEWAENNREDLLRYKAPEINKVAIKDVLVAGEELPGAKMVESMSLQIK